jgi:hypothetical protein
VIEGVKLATEPVLNRAGMASVNRQICGERARVVVVGDGDRLVFKSCESLYRRTRLESRRRSF